MRFGRLNTVAGATGGRSLDQPRLWLSLRVERRSDWLCRGSGPMWFPRSPACPGRARGRVDARAHSVAAQALCDIYRGKQEPSPQAALTRASSPDRHRCPVSAVSRAEGQRITGSDERDPWPLPDQPRRRRQREYPHGPAADRAWRLEAPANARVLIDARSAVRRSEVETHIDDVATLRSLLIWRATAYPDPAHGGARRDRYRAARAAIRP